MDNALIPPNVSEEKDRPCPTCVWRIADFQQIGNSPYTGPDFQLGRFLVCFGFNCEPRLCVALDWLVPARRDPSRASAHERLKL
jgi:hypothetical protein